MRIALCSTVVPFVRGGARNIVEWLADALRNEGHSVEMVALPESDHPEHLFDQMAAFRWIDLSDADQVICFRPQSHLIRHPNKVVWFIHHIRAFYDLWDHPEFGHAHTARNQAFREALHRVDTAALQEARKVFTNSAVVSDRLRRYNGIDAPVLYPPVQDPARFVNRGYGDEVVYVSRIEAHKRQHLLVEALRHTTTDVRVRLCGVGVDTEYVESIWATVVDAGLQSRVTIDNRWISEDEKASILSGCLAVAYLPLDEDSYGYPTLEAAHAQKPLLTTTDSGGVLEFVVDGDNGYCVEPDPVALARRLDDLYRDRGSAAQMGDRARRRIAELGVSWTTVVERLLA